jgi:XTP/dITP diphosphohydrolase
MKLIMASNNQKKLEELRRILAHMGIEVLSQKEAGLHLDVEETGHTFAENAYLKADAACKASGCAAVADDSGLVVDALNGAPGIYSARYGTPDLDDKGRYELLLKNLENEERRTAKFVSSIVCVFPNGDKIEAYGECQGEIMRAPKGVGGFGYDPIFFVPEYGKSMAELTPEEKDAISHRGAAMRQFKDKLDVYLRGAGC